MFDAREMEERAMGRGSDDDMYIYICISRERERESETARESLKGSIRPHGPRELENPR